jgi:hypothetical protein
LKTSRPLFHQRTVEPSETIRTRFGSLAVSSGSV